MFFSKAPKIKLISGAYVHTTLYRGQHRSALLNKTLLLVKPRLNDQTFSSNVLEEHLLFSEAHLGRPRMSLIWILEPFVSRIEEEAMSLSVSYCCICACICRCRSSNPSLCRLSSFHLSYVAVSGPCRYFRAMSLVGIGLFYRVLGQKCLGS